MPEQGGADVDGQPAVDELSGEDPPEATRAIAPLVASAASSAVGRSSSVAFSTSGVRNVMYRLSQSQFAGAPFPFVPRFFEQLGHAVFKFAELLFVQS